MSKYKNIIPDDIQTNTFEWRGMTIELEVSNIGIHEPWEFFNKSYMASDSYSAPPPHYIGIKSDRKLLVNRFDFIASWDVVAMTIKDYRIESSIDGEGEWKTLYTGIIPNTDLYNVTCEFSPTFCNAIRLVQLTSYDKRGYKWIQGGHFSIYAALGIPQIYTNQDSAYYIPEEGEIE